MDRYQEGLVTGLLMGLGWAWLAYIGRDTLRYWFRRFRGETPLQSSRKYIATSPHDPGPDYIDENGNVHH